jgi:putative DNA primase/helicase
LCGAHTRTTPGVQDMRPETSTPMKSPIVEHIPEQLSERPQWVRWRVVERKDKKPTKVPHIPGTERRASSTDLMTWRTFEEALAACEAGEPPYDGIGFVFCSADPFVGIDCDDCRNADTGEVEPWARTLINSATEAYVEASPSGTGIHIIACGVLKEGVKTKSVEVYGQDRFFTISGAAL